VRREYRRALSVIGIAAFGEALDLVAIYQFMGNLDKIPSPEIIFMCLGGSAALLAYVACKETQAIYKFWKVHRKIWKYDGQTLEDWKPDGRLAKKWLESRGSE
jgi:hypothetical protein